MEEDYYRSKEFTVITDLHKAVIRILMHRLVLIL